MAAPILTLIFSEIRLALNKARRGMLKDSEIDIALRAGCWNFYNRQIFTYRKTGVIPSSMRPYIKTALVTMTTGVGAVPSDFEKEISFVVQGANPFEGEFLSHGDYEDRRSQVIKTPTEQDPIANVEASNISIQPVSPANISLSYFVKPSTAAVGGSPSSDFYTMVSVDDGTGRATVIDPTSIDLSFSIAYVNDLVKEALLILGVKQQDNGAEKLATTISQ